MTTLFGQKQKTYVAYKPDLVNPASLRKELDIQCVDFPVNDPGMDLSLWPSVCLLFMESIGNSFLFK